MANLVVLCFFPAFTPPSSGGEMRLGSLYRALSKNHDIVLLTSTDFGARFEEIVHTPRLREMRFPKDGLWSTAHKTLERLGLQGDLAGLAFALAVNDPDCSLRQEARRLASSADYVIHEFPYSEPIFADGCPCIEVYNSHNFEASLLSSIVRGAGFEESLLKLIRLEGNLVARAQRVFATSEADVEKFRLFYGADARKLAVCPNGFDDQELLPIVKARQDRSRHISIPKLCFIGSGHYPNVEGAKFLLELAADLPECQFILAGEHCEALVGEILPVNIHLVGAVEAPSKLRLLMDVDVFLNPVVLGSGTSLKALEALGAGIPMVSTPEGVRGLGLVAGAHCEIVNRSDFVAAIRRVLGDGGRRIAIAAAGLEWVRTRFAWSYISSEFGEQLSEAQPRLAQSRALILALNDYSVLHSNSGGSARVRNLLMNLDSDVVLVSFGDTCQVELIAPGILHVTLPKSASHRAFEASVNADQSMSVNDGVAALFVGSNRALTEVVCAIALRAHAAVFEHPYMAPILDVILALRPDLPIVYSAHNVEATHKAEILSGHRIGDVLSSFIVELERRLVSRVKLVVCCTDADAAHFASAGVQTLVVPNGCTIPEEAQLFAARRDAPGGLSLKFGFLGSSHGPNVEAAEFIVRELAPNFPEARFEMIGGVCTVLRRPLPDNVELHGQLMEFNKTSVMANWDIALNPVESGGGSSLKLADFMAHGLYSLNTPAGARGFTVEEHEAGCILDRDDFRAALAQIIVRRDMFVRQSANARNYAVEELAWKAITTAYRKSLHSLLQEPSTNARQRLLVVTYRYTEPSLGGAEEYLIEILKRLRPRFGQLDLAAIDVDRITNQHHFGCHFSIQPGGASRRLGSLFDRTLFFPPDTIAESAILACARGLERAWTREESSVLIPFAAYLSIAKRLRLFGGFFWPENIDGAIRRWTSPIFSFLLPRTACSFQIAGYASTEKTLNMKLINVGSNGETEVVATHTLTISPRFNVNVALPPKADAEYSLLLSCEVEEHTAPGDHRPFGVLLESASVLIDNTAALDKLKQGISPLEISIADLNEQIEEELRIDQFEKWLTTLYEASLRRDSDMNNAFARIRGPHSRALQNWLADNAHGYDGVLIQGIPFDLIPSSVETLTRLELRPRVVTLPHFHGDDRFYHWRRFFESFTSADANLLFSSSVAERLDPDTRYIIVPGGGVSADEHGDPTAARAFHEIHQSNKPFFLCLGRKTASKGYEQVVRVQQDLWRSGSEIELVLIGPDEDGRRVTGEGVYYLGRQPREIIRGALASCLGLVTMSRSESFGIVLCEAWLFGKPVIANRACYSFRELVRDGESGLLVTTDAELTAALVRLANQPLDRARLGLAGFEEVVRKFTWEKVADLCYDALLGSQSDINQ